MRDALPEWVVQRIDPTRRYGLRLTLFAIATLLVMVPFSFLLVQVTSEGALTRVDTNVASSINEAVHGVPVLVGAAFVVSFLGTPLWFWLTVGSASIFFWRRGEWRVALFLVATNALGGLIDTVVKIVVDRPRPEVAHPIAHALGKSFPSGHTMASTVGYGSLLLVFLPFVPKRWRVPLVVAYLVMVGLVATSRLALGVHYVSDVLGGFVLGLAWLIASVAAFRIWRRERRRKTTDVLEGAEPEVAR